jgi:predicted RNA binding protein YcfA (HicA-like mRNA interferase family)
MRQDFLSVDPVAPRERIALGILAALGRHRLACYRIACNPRSRQGRSVGKDSRDLTRELEADGWRFVGATGSHHHFKHPTKPGKVTVPHPRRDLHPKTVRSIYRQSGLKERR